MQNNKLLILFTSVLLLTAVCSLQSQRRVTYAYDAAGNRISRTITLVSAKNKSAQIADKQEPFTELIDNREVKIYPNPTRGRLTVEINGGASDEKAILHLYDMQGVLLQKTTSSHGTPCHIDMSAYPASTYILRLQTSDNTIDYKIIKQ